MYTPEEVPSFNTVEDLAQFVGRELRRVSEAFTQDTVTLVAINVAPSKPAEGLVVFADGTNWNPGGGRGIYAYISGSWNKLST